MKVTIPHSERRCEHIIEKRIGRLHLPVTHRCRRWKGIACGPYCRQHARIHGTVVGAQKKTP